MKNQLIIVKMKLIINIRSDMIGTENESLKFLSITLVF